MTGRVRLIKVVSKGRSGSTLLDTLLGQVDGWFSTGELEHLWEWSVMRGHRCGCGELVVECPIWSRVVSRWLDRGESLERLVALKKTVNRWHNVVHLFRSSRSGTIRPRAVREYVAMMAELYQVVAEVTGVNTIVDSSKLPSPTPFGLVPNTDVAIVHLVRDPRAVVHSWKRTKPWDPSNENESMPRWGAVHSSLSWLAHNGTAELIRTFVPGIAWHQLRYEDLVARPEVVLNDLLESLGAPPDPLRVSDGRRFQVVPTHTVFGNASRFVEGEITVRNDDAWRRQQSARTRVVTSVLTFPLRQRYGYGVRKESLPPGP